MRKLMLAVLAVASLGAGAALAQDGGSTAGGAWTVTPNNNPIPGTPEYYGNSGWPPAPQQPQPNTYGYSQPIYPHAVPDRRGNRDRDRDGIGWRDRDRESDWRDRDRGAATRRDRDGDGVANRLDRYPDDPRRN